ncbi:LOW QUALITY PROTEIN: helicase-like transcription factor [Rhinatrema bivittatum]|uniref:LOW QUALITY PROTEIN: helicase-like transcription factor n=1 Tax=Rhinatrema bivittatum TaxID=194408 RepID=UPI00112E2593|nr:LOW QUALITY PROTEIN: helicase-like transcription factor [Rhinatrema bivittatum]
MSWMFMRGSVWKYLQSAHHGRTSSPLYHSPPAFFLNSEPEEMVSVDDPAASADEEMDSAVLFGVLRGNVVGLRYYTGVVNNNEMVSLQREPNNPYDRNAVKVNNVNGDQVGHIKKELAAALAYIMDSRLAKVEGVVPHGANNAFTMPVQLSFWGKEENKQAVLNHLKRHGFKLAPLTKSLAFNPEERWITERAGPSYSAPVLPAVQMTAEQLKTEFDKLFEDLKEDDKTREMEPAEAVATPLLPHQKQALAWMVSRENSKELPPFWEQRNNLYYNTLTNFSEKEKPENVLGGILGDDMGLGKTLAAIALILTNFHDGNPLPVEKRETDQSQKECNLTDNSGMYEKGSTSKHHKGKCGKSSSGKHWKDATNKESAVLNMKEESEVAHLEISSSRLKRKKATKVKYTFISDSEEVEECLPRKMKVAAMSQCSSKVVSKKRTRATLIICPLSVLSNWIDQVEQHVRPDVHMNVYVYYGPERSKDPEILSKQDVVLTTYSVLTYDYGCRGNSPLHKVRWLRVVLDEGHTIRNPNAQQTKAAVDLEADRRWVLTGTPIQNSLKDLWSLLSFFKLKPFADKEWWHRTIQRPVTMGDQGGLRRLQALVKNITLRRTKTSKVKGKAVLELPERKVFIQHITLSEDERQVYESLKHEGRAVISRYFNEGTVLMHYADVLALLVRLRQLCCHLHLVTNTSFSGPPGESTPEELREKLVNKIKLVVSSGSDEECAICLDSLIFPVITQCAHVFCKPCICQVIHSEQPNAKCPLCRGELHLEHLVECPQEESETATVGKTSKEWLPSSKVSALMHALIELRKKDPAIKSLIVSQFTAFLSIIETPLRESGFVFARLDGSMTQKKRIEAIQCFQSPAPESPTIMLLSLKAGGVGLNLTAASRVFLMDPAWNPAAEEQCFDRCHRLGQKQEVIITKFIVKNSVEENMLKIQDKKRELAAGAFGAKKMNSSEMKQAKINEIKTLIDM